MEIYFGDLAQLKQEEKVESFVVESQKLAVMVLNVTERKLTVFFVEGLAEHLKGLVWAFNPNTLQEAIARALNLEDLVTRDNFTTKKATLPIFPKRLFKKNITLSKHHLPS